MIAGAMPRDSAQARGAVAALGVSHCRRARTRPTGIRRGRAAVAAAGRNMSRARRRDSGAGSRSRSAGWSACGTGGSRRRRRSIGPRTASPACSRARAGAGTANLRNPLSTCTSRAPATARGVRLHSYHSVSRNSTRVMCSFVVVALQALAHPEPAQNAMRSSVVSNAGLGGAALATIWRAPAHRIGQRLLDLCAGAAGSGRSSGSSLSASTPRRRVVIG